MLFVQPAQPITPIIVKVVEQPAKEISVADILLGSVGITGLFLAGALLLGLALGGIFILIRRVLTDRETGGPVDSAFHLTHPPEEHGPRAADQ